MHTTCWTMIRAAGDGDLDQRTAFVELYEPAVRAYAVRRWPGLQQHDDIVQDVFVECLRQGGVLERAAGDDRPRSFRAFLLGVVRNVARRVDARHSERQATTGLQFDGPVDDDNDPARRFDRKWATMIVREARRRVDGRLRSGTDAARQRAELLRLRYQEGLPVREIAPLLAEQPRRVHHRLEEARREFRDALLEVISFHVDGDRRALEQECQDLLSLISDAGWTDEAEVEDPVV